MTRLLCRAAALAVLLTLPTTAAARPALPGRGAQADPASGPQETAQQLEVAEIRVQGNYDMPDAEILEIAGVEVGAVLTVAELELIERRLRDSGRFGSARVEQRFRSLSRRDRVVLLITVEQKTGAGKFLFLPEINYNEDEKFSVGARVSAKDLLGAGELISVPATIGGVDRVALEISRGWDSGYRVGGQFQFRQFENPALKVRDRRVGGGLWVERRLSERLSFRINGDFHDVDFAERSDTLLGYGASVTYDSRPSRVFAYNSVFASAGWRRVDPGAGAGVNRYRLELAAYRVVVGQLVLAARGELHTADGPLPDYERPYIGGMVSLRGYPAGAFSGDSTALGTVELRLPVTNVMVGGLVRLGVAAFWDTGTTWDHGQRLGDQRFRHGVGGGVFAQAPLIRLNVDVANNLEGDTRVHFGFGFRF